MMTAGVHTGSTFHPSWKTAPLSRIKVIQSEQCRVCHWTQQVEHYLQCLLAFLSLVGSLIANPWDLYNRSAKCPMSMSGIQCPKGLAIHTPLFFPIDSFSIHRVVPGMVTKENLVYKSLDSGASLPDTADETFCFHTPPAPSPPRQFGLGTSRREVP